LVKKTTNFVGRKNFSRILNLQSEISHLFKAVLLFVGETLPFFYKKSPKQHGQGNFLENFQKQFSYFEKEKL